ncbi:hypothetical protein EfmJHP10_09340 [Enterococcus faecium]|nr:hypothetical protein EfmJHP10_09340 [Enterococcus faecium]
MNKFNDFNYEQTPPTQFGGNNNFNGGQPPQGNTEGLLKEYGINITEQARQTY